MTDTIESLRQQLAECQKKKLTQKYTMLKRAVSAEQQLAESQARVKVLRDALNSCHRYIGANNGYQYGYNESAVHAALTLPSDSTALDSAIRQAKREALLEAAGKQAFSRPDDQGRYSNYLRRMADELKGD